MCGLFITLPSFPLSTVYYPCLLYTSQTANFHVIQEIQKEGYRLTQEDLTRMRETGVQANTLIAVQKIFGMEAY